MSMPILATKLYIPAQQPKTISRSHLIERLNEGLHQEHSFGRKLTLISAPAGFGKTTLVSEWVQQKDEAGGMKDEDHHIHPSSFISHPFKTAWLSLDEGDNDLTRFLIYFISALQTAVPEIGKGVMNALQSAQPPPTETILTILLNEITAVSSNILFILDDYHVIDSQAIDSALTFLLDHLPPQLHLVITTREDPPFPLHRYRARRQLTELRAADLRFTSDEAAAFLNHTMGLTLSTEEVAALETRTEGWIAGLQMAALSMQGRSDTAGFIQAFTGSHRFVLDYLLEEVLQRQPEQVRGFLLDTAVLDRLCSSLCDAVTEQKNGKEILQTLERGNLFIIPLDDKRQWYRYHHLFAEVLQTRALEEQPDRIARLHQRASEWYEQHGLMSDAIRHALAAKDFNHAASLLEMEARSTRRSSSEAVWRGWVQGLPDEMIRVRPVLSVYYALALLPAELDAAEARLRDAEQWLAQNHDRATEIVVADKAELQSLPGTISVARAYRAGVLGDLPGIMEHAQQALDLLPEDDHLWRGAAAALLGMAHWISGNLEAAAQSITEGAASLQMSGDLSSVVGAKFLLADIKVAQGRLRKALRICEQMLQLATEQESVVQGTADLHTMLAEIYIAQNELESAAQQLSISQELGDLAELLEMRHRWPIARAQIKETQGDLDSALDLLDEAERLYIGGPAPDARSISALKARVWLRQGRLNEALAWVQEQNLSPDEDLHFLREFDHITLARILIAQHQHDQSDDALQDASALLERLRQSAEAGGRTGNFIEILILQALAHETQGNNSAALSSLKYALTLAESEGYVRVFINEGQPIKELLQRMKIEGERPNAYVYKLLTAFESQYNLHPSSLTPHPPSPILPHERLPRPHTLHVCGCLLFTGRLYLLHYLCLCRHLCMGTLVCASFSKKSAMRTGL